VARHIDTSIIYVIYTEIEPENALKAGFVGVGYENEQIMRSSQKSVVKKKQAMSVLLSYAQPQMLDLSPGGGYILF